MFTIILILVTILSSSYAQVLTAHFVHCKPEPILTHCCYSQTPAHLLLQNGVGEWPPYARGKGEYQWVLSKRARDNGLTYFGSNERLRAALNRAMQGVAKGSNGYHGLHGVDVIHRTWLDLPTQHSKLVPSAGTPIKVATIGGSITAGQGAVDAPSWPVYMANYLQDELGKKLVTLNNGTIFL